MDIMTLAAKLTLDSGQYESGIKKAEGGFAKLGKSISAKSVALGTMAGNLLTSAAKGAFGAVKNMIGGAIDAYADFEQLVGGVETLLGTRGAKSAKEYGDLVGKSGKAAEKAFEKAQISQEMTMNNAKEAYRTAGISANHYMETATGFAAAMVSSLQGDTVRAAQMTDKAIQDMSDNANKMGTDFESVENAYKGFSKGNFTMLDNLKLGYGGTKEEMERLLKDARKITGEFYDASNFADIVEAIHVIQENKGITGTTAKEAASTIAGSKNMLKAAWENVLVAMAAPEDFKMGEAVGTLIDSAKTYLKNLLPAAQQVLSGLGDFLEAVLPDVLEKVPELIADFAPKLLKAGKAMLNGFGKGLKAVAKKIKLPTWDDVKSAAQKAWDTVKRGVSALGGLIFGNNEDGSVKWPTWDDVKNAAKKAWETIKEKAAAIADTLGGLVFGRSEDGTVAWPDITQLVKDFGTWWSDTALPALQKGMKWALTLFGVPENTAEDITNLVSGWWNTWVSTAQQALQWFLDLPNVPPHEAGERLREIIAGWWKGVKSYAEGVLKWTLGLFGIGDADGTGTKEMISSWWTDKVVPLLTDALNFTLGLFGLPSVEDMAATVTRWWGEVTDKVKQVALSVTATVSEWITTIKSWLDGTGITQIALDFGATVADWISTIKSWLDGTGVTAFTIQIGATVSGWIQTIADWVQNGINITANFLGLGDGGGEDTWSEGEGGTFTGEAGNMGGSSHGFAKGLNTVPYDDYVARLHRGEMVLTASQARRYRDGQGGGADLAAMAQAVAAAVQSGMADATVNSYLDGRSVTGGVSRRQMNRVKARRFAG